VNKDDKNLTTRQQIFVKEVVKGKSATQAVLDSGYESSTRKAASVTGTHLMANPKIQSALARELADAYPDAEAEAVAIAKQCLQDPDAKYETKLKMLEFLAKVKSWYAPTKSANINVAIRDKFKLPEE